ncbi:MAG: haloacid dehalogenase-like hydrolase [Myxococcales bacterium]|nr:haloacid dehalogenase-like hydrolase [Myxococcales bacterium]
MKPLVLLDVDGTLLPRTSLEREFYRWLDREGLVRFPGALEMIANYAFNAHWRWDGRFGRGKGYLGGIRAEPILRFADEFAERIAHRWVSPLGFAAIDRWRAAGAEIWLLTGSADFLARPFARRLGIAGGRGCPVEIEGGRFTGRVAAMDPYGPGKLLIARAMTRETPGRPVIAYGNGYPDRHLLRAADRPVAVNPDPLLRRLARRESMPIERWPRP